MAESLLRLKVDSSEYDSKLKRATQGIMAMNEACHKIGGTLAVTEQSELNFVKAIGEMETVSVSAKGKMSELQNSLTELSVVYKNLTDEEKSSPFGKALSSSIDQIKVRSNEMKNQLKEVNEELGETKENAESAGMSLSDLAGKFGLNLKSLSLIGAALAVCKAAFETLTTSISNSEEATDEFGSMTKAASSVFNSFANTLNGESFGGFISNINNVIAKATEAYNAMDKLETMTTIISPERVKTQADMEEQRAIIKRKGKDSKEGKAAQSKLVKLEEKIVEDYTYESKLNKDAARTAIALKLAEHGINLDKKSFDFVVSTFFDRKKYDDLIRNAKGQKITTAVQGGSSSAGTSVTITTDKRNINKKIADALTDDFRKSVSPLFSAAEQARLSSFSTLKGDARYIKELTEGGNDKKGSNPKSKGGISGLKEVAGGTDYDAALAYLIKYSSGQNDKSRNMEIGRILAGMNDPVTGASGMRTPLAFEYLKKSMKDAVVKNGDGVFDLDVKFDNIPKKMKEAADMGFLAWEDFCEKMESRFEISKKHIEGIKTVSSGLASCFDAAASAVGKFADESEGMAVAQQSLLIAGAIANLVAQFAEIPKGAEIWSWIAGTIAGTATLVSSIVAIKEAASGSYAEGGVVPGSYNGGKDSTFVYASPGEIILNRSQQTNLAGQLVGGGGKSTVTLKGEDLILAINNTGSRKGIGKIQFAR